MEIYEQKHLEALRPDLAGCTLFLKRSADFPLPRAGAIAVFGNGVRYTIKGGTGSGDVNSRFYDTVEKGLENAGFTITTKAWLDAFDQATQDAKAKFIDEVRTNAKKAKINIMGAAMGAVMSAFDYDLPLTYEGEAAVYVLSRNSGEGNDRNVRKGDFLLTDTEVREILDLNAHFERFMLVLNVGGPVDLSPVREVKNILILSQLGVETGDCLADILLGIRNPSGKLSTTWDTYGGYPALGTFGGMDDSEYKEGIYVGYRYYDTVGERPMYPFGFGLSYTDFEIRETALEADGPCVTLTAEVTNTGTFAGREVAQVYVSAPSGYLDKPYQELRAYQKTKLLQPGETETLRLTFDLRDCASYDRVQEAFVLDGGRYTVRLGNSSDCTKAAGTVILDGSVVVRKLQNRFRDPGFTDWVPDARQRTEETGTFTLQIPASSVPAFPAAEAPVFAEDARIRDLLDEELARLTIGAHAEGKGMAQIIGSASFKVCGAAGECDPVLEKKLGLSTLVMADGPAGIRISDRYYVDKKGCQKGIGNKMIDDMMQFMPAIAQKGYKLMSRGPKQGTKIYEQYATAIPIGTAIAQSFDPAFAGKCGDIVGEEMEHFGIQLWLAPGMNIHRNPLCGRNFEYYSEDPFLTGKTAAAIVKGVQQHQNCGATIKHLFANNQELDRYFHNAHISERAIREIYLKGFEICVREADPKAIMTSYNLVNDVHTSEDSELIKGVVYSEWGYRGIVMTDWVVGHELMYPHHKHPLAKAVHVIKAGGTLFMPGSSNDLQEVMDALKNGELTRTQLAENVSRLIENAKGFTA
ncbi:MAG: glycoside hydrolase family 3 C-terminal domain-containing protein [Lachnospiraceae bacterium]|nr:glycoside hydrolase family 3 C-terminal domain-containing protein [Lachnospiraceae bacterium]